MLAPLLVAVFGVSPCPGLPLRAGTEWIYRAEVSWAATGGGSAGHRTISWRTTVLTVRASDSSLAATVRGWPTDLAWWQPGRAPTISVIYCKAGRVYLMQPPTGAAMAVAESLLSGTRQPSPRDLILQLPLRSGQLFGREASERQDTFYAWLVEGGEPVPASIRRLRPGPTDSLYSLVYRTLPDHTIVGFVPGLGVVHYVYSHHGTTAEADAWLVAYHAR